MLSEYEINARRTLTKMGVNFNSVEHADRCPPFCESDGKHIHGERYRVTFSRGRTRLSLDFWNSQHDSQNGAHSVEAYDVIACLTKSDPGSFEDFASDFGYDTDSRKAESTYRAVVREWKKVERFFTENEREILAEIS